MAFIPSIKNGFILLTSLSPLLLAFFLIMSSVIDSSLRGLVYLGGVLICYLINMILTISFTTDGSNTAPQNCSLINWGWASNTRKDLFASNSMFLAFTSTYLIMPMVLANPNQINIGMIVILGLLWSTDAVTRVIRRCLEPLHVCLGTLIGGLLGVGYACAIFYSKNGNLLFFNEIISNNVVCSRPQTQKFKCAIYKNGELVKRL